MPPAPELNLKSPPDAKSLAQDVYTPSRPQPPRWGLFVVLGTPQLPGALLADHYREERRMATETHPIDHPTVPGRYEAEDFPLYDLHGARTYWDAYQLKADGTLWLEDDNPDRWTQIADFDRHRVEVEAGPFRRIDADGKPQPTTPHVIGLVGKKRTGKDTTARELAEHGYQAAAFADPLRDMALAIDPMVGFGPLPGDLSTTTPRYYSEVLAALGYEAAKETFPEVRRFLQRLGTEGVRDVLGTKYGLRDLIGDDLWIVLAEQRIQSSETPLVFTDTRFPNEAALIERYGDTVRIVRPALPASTDDHPSETALDDYSTSYELVNDSTTSGLANAVDTLVLRITA
ncbi:deoxynucleoside monophosphate kinase [Microbacterium phage Floof]|uniref:Deoxynucleoside monophosphate kinase n=1 Tax=Microbacterium phage Floof TaxID=2201433 RepID=A0A2Z4Q491_9CAUD|nr:deoxynucleoside monophosphate kinase [Microbacterium phage Floof]